MLQVPAPAVVLASSSASRRALLEAAGLRFEARPAAVDEAAIKEAAQAEGLTPAEAAILLAEAKAERVARRAPEALVIGGDQLLVCEGRWFDKPESLAQARENLLWLRGKRHELVNGTVIWRGGQRIWQDVTIVRLTFRDFSEAFLDAYLAAEGEVLLASVGAYRLEGLGVHLMAKIEGEHSAILGMPLTPLLRFLRQHGVLLA
jgi:septum formation protein